MTDTEKPKYTESDMRVLTEAALRLGRKEAGEEIAEALEALDPKASTLACAFLAREIATAADMIEPKALRWVPRGDS